jgi:cytoskeleton protein RodZ
MSDGLQAQAGLSAGALLKQAREAQGLHIAALAVSLKVPVKKLEALEADRHDLMPDAVFARALASSVCRSLKIDATEILARLPQTLKPRLSHHEQSINTPFRLPTDGPAPSVLSLLKRPLVQAVLALLLGALVLIFIPNVPQKTSEVANAALDGFKTSPVLSTSVDNNAGGTAMGAGTPVYSSPDASTTRAQTVAVTGQITEPVAVNAAAVLATSPSAVSASVVASTALATATATLADGIVVFRAKGESWVEVIDARGLVSLRRTLAPGESASANGTMPLRVTVGRADQTQVFVRGQAFEDDARVRDNVLRFEVR